MRLRSLGLMVVMAMIVASCGGGAPEAAGPNEGIQVHGDWTIDIYNEDGSLDKSVGFTNAFVGAQLLTNVLAGDATVGPFNIIAYAQSPGITPCSTLCVVEASPSASGDVTSLSASFTADQDGEVEIVETEFFTCDPSIPASTCTNAAANASGDFTIKNVGGLDWDGDGTPNDGPIPISDGQTVQVVVDISFTSG